jgi:signal peptidase I
MLCDEYSFDQNKKITSLRSNSNMNIFKRTKKENIEDKTGGKFTKDKVQKELIEIAILVLALLCIRSSVFGNYKIPSGSMIPTLLVGDHLFGNKLAYSLKVPFTKIHIIRWGTPQRGDVVSFKYPLNENLDYTKRVIGLPGDTVELKNNRLIINGKMVERKFLEKTAEGISLYEEDLFGIKHKIQHWSSLREDNVNYGPVKIPAEKYFCMGDNRDNSLDSRSWGFVPLENFEGRLGFRWMHIPENGWIPKFDTIGIIRN